MTKIKFLEKVALLFGSVQPVHWIDYKLTLSSKHPLRELYEWQTPAMPLVPSTL